MDGAVSAGVQMTARDTVSATISVLGGLERFEILHTFEFSSDRKVWLFFLDGGCLIPSQRMSVVVRSEAGEIRVFSKGADDVLFARLSRSAFRLLFIFKRNVYF